MAVDNNNVIDFIGLEKDSNAVILTISDHLDWTLKMDHLLKLQAKINSYLAFIKSGEIFKSYPEARDKNIVIEVAGQFNLPGEDDVKEFYVKVQKVLDPLAITLRFKKVV